MQAMTQFSEQEWPGLLVVMRDVAQSTTTVLGGGDEVLPDIIVHGLRAPRTLSSRDSKYSGCESVRAG
jgi:hypothetical protein